MNIFEHFIMHEIIICDDIDLPWMSKQIETLTTEQKRFL